MVLSSAASLERARAMRGRGHFLCGAGGRHPAASSPEGTGRRGRGCDAAGFVAWCLGYDRHQPGFAAAWDWVNADSIIAEADTSARWFRPLVRPEAGAVIAYPSIDLSRDGGRDRAGHVGIVAAVPALWTGTEWSQIRIIHCAATVQRRLGHAIDETHAAAWGERASFRGHSHPRWRTRFLGFVAQRGDA